jgi:hypothetical protein
MKKPHFLSLLTATFLTCLSLTFTPVYGLDIPQNRLEEKTLTIKVAPGKVTAIHFTTGEKIINYLLSDETKLIHNLNAPEGEATTFMLREIKPDPLYGATRSSVPNLLLTTRLPDGTTQLYEFLITFEKQISNNERVIRVTNPSYRLADHKIFTSKGEVTLDHVQAGLSHILATQQASSFDPIIQQIKQFLALANQMPLEQALNTSQVDIEAVKRLGEIGFQLNQSSPSPSNLTLN